MKGVGGSSRSRPGRKKNISELNIPEAVDYGSAFKLYHLDRAACTLHSVPNPKTQNCRDNVYCLGRLGQQKWDKEKQAIDKEGKATAKSFSRREVTTVPCGLVNLGNSCYLNSFIQIYFSDPFFRRLIYSWHPVENFTVPVGEKVNIEELMLCLQRLFVTLQVTPYEDANAEHLAKLLQLDSEQHDALEFQILLFNKIEKLLSSREEWKDVKDAIVNRSKGVITQQISCTCGRESVCDVPFHPFILGIERVNSLSKALEAYFSAEQLPDYVCPTCKTPDVTVRSFTVKEPPPVLTIQVNRFTFDAAGRKKKVRSALQYLREMEFCGVMYENCAVMVHEGPNADCGHYYDIIKHPDTGKWFTYNDEVVKPTTAPGVVSEKERITKTTPDMKGCYALIYRRKNDTDNDVPEPPDHLAEEIVAALDAEFLADKIEASGSSNKSQGLMGERHQFLINLWKDLQVQAGKEVRKHPDSIVFLPTQLLCEIQSKEFDAFMKLKDKINKEKKTRLDSVKKKDASEDDSSHLDVYLSPCSFQLCRHGKLSLESILRGELKAVRAEGAEKLIRHYGLLVTSSDGADFPRKTGNDICITCVADKKAEFDFLTMVESRERIAKQLLKEKAERFYHAENCLWVSTRSLYHYRKMAIRAYRQQRRMTHDYVRITFSSADQRSTPSAGKCLAAVAPRNVGQHIKKEFSAVPPDTEGVVQDTVLKNSMEDCMPSTSGIQWKVEENADCDSKNCLESETTSVKILPFAQTVVHNEQVADALAKEKTPTQEICLDVCVNGDALKDGEASAAKKRKVEDGMMDLNGVISLNQNGAEVVALSTVNGGGDATEAVRELDAQGKECDPTDNYSDEAMSCENGTSTESVNEMDLGAKEPKDEEEDSSDEEDAIVFNGDLCCVHDKFDFKCYETKERRIVVETWEWDNLVDDVFTPDQVYKVITDEIPCALCEENFKSKRDNNEDQQRRLQQIRSAVGELIRTVSRRNFCQESSQYTRVICAAFIKNMILRFKSGTKNVNIPRLCQECLLCGEHNLPYLHLDSERKAFPITGDEWNKIVMVMQEVDEGKAQDIVIRNGQYEVFCEPCQRKQKEIDDHQRFVFEKGADIYVKLKSDENEEPTKESGDMVFAAPSGLRPAPATRRTAAKNCMKFKLTSMNTIGELKVKIYERTGQSPNDQLLYYNDRLLYDTETLEVARIDPKELVETPLILITQSISDSADVSRELEKGFANTALSHW